MRRLACMLLASLAGVCPAAAPAAPSRLPPGARLRLGAHARTIPDDGEIVVSPDRRLVACREGDGVRLFEPAKWSCVGRLPDAGVSSLLAFTGDGKRLVVRAAKGRLALLPLGGGRRAEVSVAGVDLDDALVRFLPGERRLAVWSADVLSVRDAATGEVVLRERAPAEAAEVAFSPDGRSFGFPSARESCLVLVDLATGQKRRIAAPKRAFLSRLSWGFSPDGGAVAVSLPSLDVVRVHDVATGRLLRSARTDVRLLPVSKATMTGDGRWVALAVPGGVQLADTSGGAPRTIVCTARPERPVLGGRLDERPPDHVLPVGERHLLTCDQGRIRVWDAGDGGETTGQAHCRPVGLLTFADGGRSLTTQGEDERRLTWDVRTARLLRAAFVEPTPEVVARPAPERLVWRTASADGEWTADEEQDPSARPESGRVELSSKRGARWRLGPLANRPAFAPGSGLVALPFVRGDKYEVDLFDLTLGRAVRTLELDEGIIGRDSVWFSPDGSLLVSEGGGGLRLWEPASGRLVERVEVPGAARLTLAFGRTGRALVVAEGSEALVWDVAAKRALVRAGGTKLPGPCVLSEGHDAFAAVGEDGSVLLYDVPGETKTGRTTAAERDALWAGLASPVAAMAWRAGRRLGLAEDAVEVLEAKLRPVPKDSCPDAALLDADDFDTRQAAAARLALALKRGDRGAEEALRELLGGQSLEARLRAKRLLAAPLLPLTDEELRRRRAVSALESRGDAPAKALLMRLAAGGPGLVTAEARAALRRLSSR